MTMVRLQRLLLARTASASVIVLGVALAWSLLTSRLQAQGPVRHYQHAGVLPPGAIGNLKLKQGGPLSGYFQPVEIIAPRGARISLARDGGFTAGRRDKVVAGMLIGGVYRLRVTHIPGNEGVEVFPSVEVIDRLYPPAGQAWRFPVPIQLTVEELRMAADGKLVTRVIFIEDPQRALPHASRPREQNVYEVAAGADPLVAADLEGRPIAILRMGGRLPDPSGPSEAFLYGSPPLQEMESLGTDPEFANGRGEQRLAPMPVARNRQTTNPGSAVRQVSDSNRAPADGTTGHTTRGVYPDVRTKELTELLETLQIVR